MSSDVGRCGELFLKVFAVAFAVFSWYPVAFPHTKVIWKGGNRAPMSMRSRVVFAAGVTSWCLAGFRVYPMYSAAVFVTCVAYSFALVRQDRRAYDRLQGIGPIKPVPLSGRDQWMVFWFFDAFTLIGSGIALIRDSFSPPRTEEQHILHVMALGMFTAAVIGAIALLMNRPPSAGGEKGLRSKERT